MGTFSSRVLNRSLGLPKGESRLVYLILKRMRAMVWPGAENAASASLFGINVVNCREAGGWPEAVSRVLEDAAGHVNIPKYSYY